MNADLLAEAKRRLPLVQLMALLGHADRAKKSARCPFHDDSAASFSVFTGKDGVERFKCFAGCGEGDAIDYLGKARGVANGDACREFMRLAGVSLSPTPQARALPSRLPVPFDWPACVAAFTPEQQARLAAWRGYSPEFVAWLVARQWIGLFHGKRDAFPVHDSRGGVIGCHYHREEDGKWRYHPIGNSVAPLLIGDPATATTILAFESQWDWCALADVLRWQDGFPADTAAVITRGAGNGDLVAGLCAPSATVFAFAQNDPPRADGQLEPAAKWLAEIAAACGCKCLHVVTPQPHKDANDWTRAGATADDLHRALAEAQPVVPPAASALPTPAPENVSTSVIVPPEEPDESEPTPFPLDALPAGLAGIIAAVARTERVPVALPAVCAFGVASAALGAGLHVASGPNRTTRGNLFLLASAESGSGKSESFRLVAAPLLDHQTRLLESWRLKTSPQLHAELRVLEREIALLEKKAAKTGADDERARMLGELEYKLARKDDLARRAALPCILAQDVTTERLAVLLRDNREVAFSASADARKLVDNLLGRYNPGKTTDESLYLSGYSGDYLRVDRQGRESVVLNKPCLSLCWFVQPDLLATMLDATSLSASGFLPRLLLCDTRATPRRIEGEPQILSTFVCDQWSQLVADLLATFHAADQPHGITATPEAIAALRDYHNRIVDRRAVDLADVGGFAARYAENAWRVAVVLHAGLYGATAGQHAMDPETATNAVRVVEWFAAAQLEILAKGRHQAAAKMEEEVLDLLDLNRERKQLDFLTVRDVQRARIMANAEAARALLVRMESAGILVGEDIRPAGGGKPTRIFRCPKNPVPG